MQKMFAMALALLAGMLLTMFSGCGRAANAGPSPDRQVALEIREKLLAGAPEGAAGDAGAAEAGGTGWGTLRGTFRFDGTPPVLGNLNADKDMEVCGKNGPIKDNSLVVGPDGGIANIVIYARAKRVHESAAPLKDGGGEPLVFDQKGCMFLSHVVALQVGQKMDVRNSDPIGHNTKIDPSKGVAFNANVPAGQAVVYVPTAEEAAPATVGCSIHPWMRGYMLPRKDKYFAVTKSDGSFEIPNLPAGEEVELQAWHERGAGSNQALVLDNKELKWTNKGRFKVKLDADQTKDLELKVPASAFK